MKNFKRTLAMMLVLCMVFGMLPVSAFALELGTKPENGTVTGQPFDTSVSKNYRIPGLVNFGGTLIATADARWDQEKDGGGMDLVVSRSEDGNTWNYTFAGYLGDNGNVWNSQSSTLMDPVIVTDGETLYLLADMFPAGYSISDSSTANTFSDTAIGFDASGNLLLSGDNRSTYGYYLKDGKIYANGSTEPTAYTVKGWYDLYLNDEYVTNLFFSDSPFQVRATSYICMSTSTDGENWSDPVLLNVKPSGVSWMVVGPGSGLVTQDGDIAFTAYDNTNIYLIWGNETDGWNTAQTSAAGNESSIVELNDGTIRAFVKRNGSNTIAYVDFTKSGSTYTPGNLVDTGVTNFSNCMVSSLHYSKTLNGQEVVLVCCPSKPGAGAWNGRFNGKIHMFTLGDKNAMTHKGSYALNYESEFFAYSNMAEKNDGTIGVLYEDDCISYSAGSYEGNASHITYTTVDLAQVFNVTFDPDRFTVSTDAGSIEVKTPISAAVKHIHAAAATVDSLSKAYTAYDIHLCTASGTCTDCSSCDKAYTGSAVVKLPLTDALKSALALKPFVITDGAVEYITEFTNDGSYVTFTAPHFSVVGVAEVDVEYAYSDSVNVELFVGDTSETYRNEVGYEPAVNGLNQNIATVTMTGVADQEGKLEATVADVTCDDLISGDHDDWTETNYYYTPDGTNYYPVFAKRDSSWKFLYTDYTYTWGYSTTNSSSNVTQIGGTQETRSTSADPAITVYTLETTDPVDGYTDITFTAVSVGTTYAVIGDTMYNITVKDDVRDITVTQGLSETVTIEGLQYTMSNVTVQPDGTIVTLDSVTNDGTDTKVTFTGRNAGTTTAKIGRVTYNITVKEDVRYITLSEGFSQTVTIEGLSYSQDDVTQWPDSTIATLDSVAAGGYKLETVSTIESGKQYLLFNNRAGKTLTGTTNGSGLLLSGAATADSAHVWTIEGSGGYYTVRYGTDGGYLNVGYGSASLTDSSVTLQLDYEDAGHWLINDYQGWYGMNDYGGSGTTAAGWGDAATDNGSWWTIYKLVPEGSTEVTFTGVKAGTTTAKIGHVTYHITVKAVNEGNISDFNNIAGADKYSDGNGDATYRSDLDMTGKKITSLRISEGATFLLGVDVTGYDTVTWTTADPSVATVDAEGNVTAVKAGETTVTATVVKGGVKESITIPVIVVPSMVENADEVTTVFYYIEQVDYTDPYYTMFLSTESTTDPVEGHRLVKVSEGEVIWYERPKNSAFAWIWTADPWEGYALTKMGSSGSVDEYYPLRDVNDITKLGDGYVDTNKDGSFVEGEDSEYYYTSEDFSTNGAPNNAYKNVVLVGNDVSASWRNALNTLLNEAIVVGKGTWDNYGCDGAMSNTRWDHDGVPKLVTAMTFISDPMPQIEKSVQGILPTTRLRKDFRPYTDGMVATVNEYVYFNVRITLDRPTIWADEANGIGAITYTDAIVSDTVLPAAYFYVQANDTNMDGVITGDEVTTGQTVNITDQLNAAWGADEQTRTIDLYLIYVITEDDIPKFTITNTADLKWNYQSHYSTGKLSGSAEAEASITVVGSAIDDVVIDFGQTIVYEGLTEAQLKGVYVDTLDGDPVEGGSKVDTKYGTVTIAKHTVPDPDGNESKTTYTYTVTYTPHTILQAPDAVLMYGLGEENKEKVINGFVVYPATTVYYEEGFMLDGVTDWDTTKAKSATKEQAFELLNESVYDENGLLTGFQSDKQYAYGYDPIYATGSVAESNISTDVTTGKTSFTFTGTGFELFANSTPDTGWILVEVTRADGTNVKMYMVNTVANTGDTGATSGQETDLDSLPIVSIKNLDHGTYTVNLRKLRNDGKTVIIDGVRIVNTVADSSVFNIDLEDDPEFYQLRDMVLNSFGVALEGVSVDYKDMCDQVYSAANGATAIITSESVDYANSSTLQDLLDNGPKNELYLWAGQTLTFKVTTSRALQIGLKAPAGATNYTLTYKVGDDTTAVATNAALTSTEDLFYALGNEIGTEQEYTITVKNTGSSILSVTDLKICDDPSAAFVSLEEADIRSILLNAGYVDPDAADAPEKPEVPAADAVLNIVLVDYTGKRLSTAQLITSGPANSTAVFTAGEIMAAAKMPKGCDFADTVSDAAVICGTSGTVTIQVGKVATLKVTYVNMFGKTVGTATFTKVQTAPGFFSVTAEQIKDAAPEGSTVLWLTGAMAAYGRETNLIVPVL